MTNMHKALNELRSDADDLAKRIDALTDEWDAVEEVDTNLGVDVQNIGTEVMTLLDEITNAARRSDPLRALQLFQDAVSLHEAIQLYEELDEHETDASIDIFDRLGPGIALVRRVLDVLEAPDANHGLTNGELIAQLRQHPPDLKVWRVDPSSPDGYTALNGAVVLGHDPDPAQGEPESFLVVGVPAARPACN
ncbi:hypothetical protein ACL02S_23535 [Nocardia sp. 004]|uniref:hypothetical protein n=1 Tax=Nocardia sp. 004 TaxID=3385978 RepID=UPI00399F46FA